MVRVAQDPEVTIRLTSGSDETHSMTMDRTWLTEQLKKDSTYCPNFGTIVSFKEISLPKDPLLWPYIEITVDDLCRKDNFFNWLFGSGCEPCFTTLSLIDFQDGIVQKYSDSEYAKRQIRRGQDKLTYVQEQIYDEDYLKEIGVVEINMDAMGGDLGEEEQNTADSQLRTSVGENGMVNTTLQKEARASTKQGNVNLFDVLKRTTAPVADGDVNDISVLMGGGGGDDFKVAGMEDESSEDDPELKGGKKAAKPTPEQIGIVIADEEEPIVSTKKLKKYESKERDKKLKDLDGKIRKL